MQPLTFKRSQFRLSEFLSACHRFSIDSGGDGNPLPVAVGDEVYHDPVALADALTDDGDTSREIPDGSFARLEAGLTLFSQFTSSDGFDGLDCADGSRLRVREDEADECHAVGVAISLTGDEVEFEGRVLSDVSGECELEPMTGQDRIGKRMRRWVRSFTKTKRAGSEH